MEGLEQYIVPGAIGAIALVGGLFYMFYKGKFGSFIFEKDKEKFKVEIKAPENSTAAILSSDPTPGRDRIESKGDVHVHNYPLDENVIRQMFQEELQGFKKELGSGTKDEQENQILKKQIGDLEAKLANMEKKCKKRPCGKICTPPRPPLVKWEKEAEKNDLVGSMNKN